MSPDLNAMALFVKVVEHKSFSAASRRLGVPISTVSRKVSELEKTLGVRLLERSTRQLRLTELGQGIGDPVYHLRRGIARRQIGRSDAGLAFCTDNPVGRLPEQP